MLCFVVALRPEARPLLDRYRLEPLADRPFRIYRRDDLALVISGIGKVAAGAATAYLQAHLRSTSERPLAWLNVGVAGHGRRPVGEAVLAETVRDDGSGRSWRLPIPFDAPVATSGIVTVDRVERTFAEPVVYDMEAAGFVATARRFAPAELVQCLKVVSDGPGMVPEDLTRERLFELVAGRLDDVAAVAEALTDALGRHVAGRNITLDGAYRA